MFDPLHIGARHDPQSSDYIFFVEASTEPPTLDWGCRVGDVVHNLHSALELLAWQLVLASLRREPADNEARAVTCPIALTRNDFDSLAVIKMLDAAHVSTLRGLQPYQRGDRRSAEKHPLAILKRLSNFDKHRVIHASYVALTDFPFEVNQIRDYQVTEIIPPGSNVPLLDGQELSRVKGIITGPEPEIEGYAKLSGRVGLSDGSAAQETLDDLGGAVRDFIRAFEPAL